MGRSRMFGWDRNPLRRRTDRVKAGLIGVLIVVFMIAAPLLTIMTGHWIYGAGVRQQRSEAVAWRHVPPLIQRGPARQEAFTGPLTRPPLRRAPLGEQVAVDEVLVASDLIATFMLLGCAGRGLVRRRRSDNWDRAWLAVAPQWTKRH